MKVFTVRDLDRTPALVLDTCDKEGSVRIRRRDGRSYTVQAEIPPITEENRRRWLDDHKAWLKRTFPKPLLSVDQVEELDRLMASDGRLL